ncbi:MAG: pirin family protein [Marinilabiliaceae bacterium]|nr:pirin family protein [Marinilabiliaceae bacterium]
MTHSIPGLEVIRSESRGYFNHGWLKTYHSFSFANYYHAQRMHFGALRVINDDEIAPGRGFGLHPHDNMEIITIPIQGSLMHEDSMGHREVIRPNDVQVMSAGSGLFHAEFNASESEEVALFQIWMLPDRKNVEPVYNQATFNPEQAMGQWQQLVGPKGGDSVLTIHQQAWVKRAFVKAGDTITLSPITPQQGHYVMVVSGDVEIMNHNLHPRDALALTGQHGQVRALRDAHLIDLIVPMQW